MAPLPTLIALTLKLPNALRISALGILSLLPLLVGTLPLLRRASARQQTPPHANASNSEQGTPDALALAPSAGRFDQLPPDQFEAPVFTS